MKETGALPLDSPYCLALDENHRVLLMHGDELCTQDRAYQRFRRVVRHPWVVRLFLVLPLAWRRYLVRQLRAKSRGAMQRGQVTQASAPSATTNPSLTQVDTAEVSRLLIQHQAQALIHGHTHVPGVYPPETRLVLGEWGPLPSILRIDQGQAAFLTSINALSTQVLRLW